MAGGSLVQMSSPVNAVDHWCDNRSCVCISSPTPVRSVDIGASHNRRTGQAGTFCSVTHESRSEAPARNAPQHDPVTSCCLEVGAERQGPVPTAPGGPPPSSQDGQGQGERDVAVADELERHVDEFAGFDVRDTGTPVAAAAGEILSAGGQGS